ncbi:transmembrane and immunoglobulin domain-containing protein 1 [Leucoraja erinacea]|uniref:transmembrane and immunoglobulin domain-containing protein 1 n=1 Tax=Leucoraja erinaceus TaxID=7782 RepID=UPI002455711A|nr:transmembrane and immunoglobulin domain-containing protein 1 [Leucoraja erinacea]
MAQWISVILIFALCYNVAFHPGCAGIDLAINNRTTDHKLRLNVSDAVSLTCRVINAMRDEELVWLWGDRVVNLQPTNRINVSTLCIDPVTTDANAANVSCHVSSNSTLKRSVLLDIRFVPMLSRDGDGQVDVYTGQDATLTCNVKSNPVAVMLWSKDNEWLRLEAGRHDVHQDSGAFTLTIRKVQNKDNGTYLCRADSTLGSGHLTFHLNVKAKPDEVPFEPIVAGVLVTLLTGLFGVVSRRKKIMECCRADTNSNSGMEDQ